MQFASVEMVLSHLKSQSFDFVKATSKSFGNLVKNISLNTQTL